MIRPALAALLAMLPALAADSHLIEGAVKSPVRVLIYEDLQCPDCADFRAMLDEKLLPRYAATVRFEHRDFPLAKHAWARKAAIAARFFEEQQPPLGLAFRKYCMSHQKEIDAGNFDQKLSEFATAHHVDPDQVARRPERSPLGRLGGAGFPGGRRARDRSYAHRPRQRQALHRNLPGGRRCSRHRRRAQPSEVMRRRSNASYKVWFVS